MVRERSTSSQYKNPVFVATDNADDLAMGWRLMKIWFARCQRITGSAV